MSIKKTPQLEMGIWCNMKDMPVFIIKFMRWVEKRWTDVRGQTDTIVLGTVSVEITGVKGSLQDEHDASRFVTLEM